MKNIYKIALAILLALPTVTFAVPVSVDRLNSDHIEPLIKTDYIKASYFVASSTATSTFAGKIKLSNTGTAPQIIGWDEDTGIYFDGPDIMSLHTGGTSRLLINALGNVGIGTTTPFTTLSVVGDGWFENGSTKITVKNSANSVKTEYATNSIQSYNSNLFINAAGNNVIFSATSNVGIGTTTPISKLTIQKTITSDVDFPALALSRDDTSNTTDDSLGDIDFWSNDASNDGPGIGSRIRGVVDDTAGRSYGLSLWTRSGGLGTPISEKMRITSAGNVGIGTTTPRSRLQVSEAGSAVVTLHRVDSAINSGDEYGKIDWYTNDTQLTGGAAVATYIKGVAPSDVSSFNTANPYGELQFGVSNNTAVATAMTLSRAGNLGIASSSPTYPLTVTGNMWLQGKYAKFGDSTSEYTCINLADACVELSGDGNTAGGVFYQVGNRNAGTSAYSGLTILNDLGNLGNNATYYAGLFLNSSVYSDPTFGTANNVPNILQLGNTMGSISIQASSTLTSVPSFIQFLAGGVNTTNEIARITTTGLGIGSSTPYAKLSVTNTGTAPTVLFEDSASPDTTPFIIDANGNVGINTLSPQTYARMTISTTTGQHTLLNLTNAGAATGDEARIDFTMTSAVPTAAAPAGARIGVVRQGTNAQSDMYFSTNNSAGILVERMRLATSGNVGIGTTTPGNLLSLYKSTGSLISSIQSNGTAWTGIKISDLTDPMTYWNSGSNFRWGVTTANDGVTGFSEYMRISSTGNLGISTSTPNDKLTVYGGGIGINPGGASRPTCTADNRGDVWNTFGGAGVADTFAVCQKDAADAYSWVTK